jgi:hypothetical protein
MPHAPAWLEDVTSALVSRFDAEAVLLVGSQARGTARSESDYNLLVLVDEAPDAGAPLAHRLEAMPGFQKPVAYIRATLAEVMAGLFTGHPGWEALAVDVHPLHDPLGAAARMRDRLRTNAPGRFDRAAAIARESAEKVINAASLGRTLEAQLALVEAVSTLAREAGRAVDPGEATPARLADVLQGLSATGARALRSALSAPDPSAGADSLVKAADLLQAAIRERS